MTLRRLDLATIHAPAKIPCAVHRYSLHRARDDAEELAVKRSGGTPVGIYFDPDLALPKKRSLTIAGHRTSITLEDAFWRELKAAAAEMEVSVTALASAIDSARETASLSAAIRVFLLARRAAMPSGR